MSRRSEPVKADDPKRFAGLTQRRRERALPVGGEGFDIERSLGEDICACGRHSVKGSLCTCGRIVGRT